MSERTEETLVILPVGIGEYRDTAFAGLPVDDEITRVANALAEFGGSLKHWPVPMRERTSAAVGERLTEFEHAATDTVLYWVGHGWSNGDHAALANYMSPFEVEGNGLMPAQLALTLTGRERVADGWAIVIVDTCQSARFVQLVNAALEQHLGGARRVLLIGTSGAGATRLGVFSRMFRACLRTDFGTMKHIYLSDLARALRQRMEREGRAATIEVKSDALTCVLTRDIALPGPVALDAMEVLRTILAALPVDEQRHFLPKAQGAELGEALWLFEGREDELGAIATWLRTRHNGMLVITGPPGCGKSALLGHLVAQSRPAIRSVLASLGYLPGNLDGLIPADVLDAAILLTGATVDTTVDRLASDLRLGPLPSGDPPARVGWLLERLDGRTVPVTIVLDALDEAQHPETLARSVLAKLSQHPQVRIIVGTRPSTRDGPDLPPTGDTNVLDALDLDVEVDPPIVVRRDEEAILRYARRRLHAALSEHVATNDIERAAHRITAGGQQFLYARLATYELLTQPHLLAPQHDRELDALLTGTHRKLFATAANRLAQRSTTHLPLLQALAVSHGRGIPSWDGVWTTIASAFSNTTLTPNSIDRLLDDAAPYIMVDVEHGQTVYRLSHRTFAEHFQLTADLATQIKVRLDIAERLLGLARGQTIDGLNQYLVFFLSGHVGQAGPAAWRQLANDHPVLDRLHPTAISADAFQTLVGKAPAPPEIQAILGTRHMDATPADRFGLRQLGMCRYAGLRPNDGDADPLASWYVRWAHVVPQTPHLTLTGHRSAVLAVAASPDGRVVSGGADGTVRVWDPSTGTELARLTGDGGGVLAVAVAPDGRIVAGGADGTVRVWDAAAAGPPIELTGHDGGVSTVAVGPGGRVVSGGFDGTVRVWDADHCVELAVLAGHRDGVGTVAIGEDGRVVSGGFDGVIRVWDVDTEAEPVVLSGHEGYVATVALTTTGQVISGGDDKTVREWDLGTAQVTGQLTGHGVGAWVVAVSANGSVVSGWPDGSIHLWDGIASTESAELTGHREGVVALAFGDDGRIVSGGWDGTVRVWHPIQHSMRVADHLSAVRAVAVGAGGWVVSGGADGNLRVWDPATGMQRLNAGDTPGIVAVAASPDGRLVTGGDDGTLRAWDMTSDFGPGKIVGHHGGVTAVAMDGLRVVSGGRDGTVRVWDPDTATELARLASHRGGVLAVAITVDGLVLTGGEDGRIRIGDPTTGQQQLQLVGHRDGVLAVVASRDGRVISGGRDGTLRIWDPGSGVELNRLRGHPRGVLSIAEGPDGRVASGGRETIQIWDLMAGQVRQTIPLDIPVRCLAWTSRHTLVAGGDDGLIAIELADRHPAGADNPVRAGHAA